jgi:hypothetical protein
MVAAVYLTAYELVKYSIIEQLKNFYLSTESTGETEMLKQYTKEVLTLDKSIFVASCLWLEKMEAISNKEELNVASGSMLLLDHLPSILKSIKITMFLCNSLRRTTLDLRRTSSYFTFIYR